MSPCSTDSPLGQLLTGKRPAGRPEEAGRRKLRPQHAAGLTPIARTHRESERRPTPAPSRQGRGDFGTRTALQRPGPPSSAPPRAATMLPSAPGQAERSEALLAASNNCVSTQKSPTRRPSWPEEAHQTPVCPPRLVDQAEEGLESRRPEPRRGSVARVARPRADSTPHA
ncbi:hypothetical protein CDD83_9684 [Cordyceps sp. RAO-2017]|nr:hypothetical protein CDD83_9684 [Cordyceps sp. RAO-2017]